MKSPHPEGAIKNIEFLKNTIFLGLSVWYVPCRGTIPREWTDLSLEPGDSGMRLCAGQDGTYLTFIRIPDKTWDTSIIYYDSICGYIFVDKESARNHAFKQDPNAPVTIHKTGIGPFK
jgi:hypothetical protein